MTAETAATHTPVPRAPEPPAPDSCQDVRPAAGDILIIDGAGMAGLPLLGTIVAVSGDGETPGCLVRWTGGDYESWIVPGPRAHIEKHG